MRSNTQNGSPFDNFIARNSRDQIADRRVNSSLTIVKLRVDLYELLIEYYTNLKQQQFVQCGKIALKIVDKLQQIRKRAIKIKNYYVHCDTVDLKSIVYDNNDIDYNGIDHDKVIDSLINHVQEQQ